MVLSLNLWCNFSHVIQEGKIPHMHELQVLYAQTGTEDHESSLLFCQLFDFCRKLPESSNCLLQGPQCIEKRKCDPLSALPPQCVAIARMPFIDQTCLESCNSPVCRWAPQGAVGRHQCLSGLMLSPSSCSLFFPKQTKAARKIKEKHLMLLCSILSFTH